MTSCTFLSCMSRIWLLDRHNWQLGNYLMIWEKLNPWNFGKVGNWRSGFWDRSSLHLILPHLSFMVIHRQSEPWPRRITMVISSNLFPFHTFPLFHFSGISNSMFFMVCVVFCFIWGIWIMFLRFRVMLDLFYQLRN